MYAPPTNDERFISFSKSFLVAKDFATRKNRPHRIDGLLFYYIYEVIHLDYMIDISKMNYLEKEVVVAINFVPRNAVIGAYKIKNDEDSDMYVLEEYIHNKSFSC